MIQALRATLLLSLFAISATSFATPVVFSCRSTDFPYINRFTANGTVEVADDNSVNGTVSASYVGQANKNPGSVASSMTGTSRVYPAGQLGPCESRYLNLQLGDTSENRLLLSLDAVTTFPSRLKLGNVFYRANCTTVSGQQEK